MGQLVNGKWEQFDVRQGEKNSNGELEKLKFGFGPVFCPSEQDACFLYICEFAES